MNQPVKPEPAPQTFEFGIYTHTAGDEDCTAGWCGDSYPKPCTEPGCQGLMHANWGDTTSDGYYLETQCDVCGESE